MTLDNILTWYKAEVYLSPATEWEVDQLVMWHITNIFWFCFSYCILSTAVPPGKSSSRVSSPAHSTLPLRLQGREHDDDRVVAWGRSDKSPELVSVHSDHSSLGCPVHHLSYFFRKQRLGTNLSQLAWLPLFSSYLLDWFWRWKKIYTTENSWHNKEHYSYYDPMLHRMSVGKGTWLSENLQLQIRKGKKNAYWFRITSWCVACFKFLHDIL